MSGSGSPSLPVKPGGKTQIAPSLSSSEALRLELVDDLRRASGCRSSRRRRRSSPELHAEPLVDLRRSSSSTTSTRRRQSASVCVVAALQEHDALARALGEGRVAVELRARLAVERVEIARSRASRRRLARRVEQVLDQHAERRAPVAEVVLADDAMAERSSTRASASPMSVLRMCPTCISFATFGEE